MSVTINKRPPFFSKLPELYSKDDLSQYLRIITPYVRVIDIPDLLKYYVQHANKNVIIGDKVIKKRPFFKYNGHIVDCSRGESHTTVVV